MNANNNITFFRPWRVANNATSESIAEDDNERRLQVDIRNNNVNEDLEMIVKRAGRSNGSYSDENSSTDSVQVLPNRASRPPVDPNHRPVLMPTRNNGHELQQSQPLYPTLHPVEVPTVSGRLLTNEPMLHPTNNYRASSSHSPAALSAMIIQRSQTLNAMAAAGSSLSLTLANGHSSNAVLPLAPPGQSIPYAYPSTSSFPLGLYAMEQADRLHLEEAAAKHMKKLRPKKFRCELCDVAFSNNGQLKGHMRIHTGERPYKCDAEGCGKSFTRNEELTRHKRIHTGIRPHGCIVCGKHFGRKDHLKKHLRTHENRDPYRLPLGMYGLEPTMPQRPPFPPFMYPY